MLTTQSEIPFKAAGQPVAGPNHKPLTWPFESSWMVCFTIFDLILSDILSLNYFMASFSLVLWAVISLRDKVGMYALF